MTLSLWFALGWLVLANVTGMFPSKHKHWPQAYALIAIGADIDEPIFNEAIDEILAACKENGVVAGIHTGAPDYARRMAEKGFRFITLNSDTGLLKTRAESIIAEFNGDGTEAAEASTNIY